MTPEQAQLVVDGVVTVVYVAEACLFFICVRVGYLLAKGRA